MRNTHGLVLAVSLALILPACGGQPPEVAAPAAAPSDPSSPAVEFLEALRELCGLAFAGRVVANEPAQPDDPFDAQPLVMHVRTCEGERLLMPLHVGEDRSRTWVLTLHGDRLRLKHDHRHEDGSEDVLTMYGGDSIEAGSDTRQEFPVDEFSIALFTREGREVSNTNTWAMELHRGVTFAYELTRPGRTFRLEFDLTNPVSTPPAPWGH